MGNVIARIAFSGGPKAGKTTIKEDTKKMIEEEYGFKVFLVPETATEIIEAGFIPSAKPEDGNKKKMTLFRRTNIAFQKMILDLQIAKELAFEIAAQAVEEDVVIIYDRGIMDNKGYLMKNLGQVVGRIIFEMMIRRYRLTEEKINNRYDAVIILETIAKIKEFSKKVENDNTKRIESGNEEAIEVDNNVTEAWKNHKNRIIIKATETPEEKKDLTLDTVRGILNKKLEKTQARKLTKKI